MSRSAEEVAAIRDKYVALSSVLNEASRRRWVLVSATASNRRLSIGNGTATFGWPFSLALNVEKYSAQAANPDNERM